MKGSYLYDITLPLIDYCGDIRGKRDTYSQKYSPNNIRRLYISPDGAVVMYHVNVGKGKRSVVSYQPELVMQCQQLPDYVPIMYVLSADRVCASIEEVVICTGSNSGASLDTRELDFTGLVKSYKGGGSDIKQVIMNRYKRLHSFIIYSGTLTEFINRTEDCIAPYRLLTDSEFVRSTCQAEFFHKDDWYKSYGSSAKFYQMDMSGSPLNKHFIKVKEYVDAYKEHEDLNKFKHEKVKGLEAEFRKKYEQCLQLMKGYTRLRAMERELGSSVLGVELPAPMFLSLKKFDGLGKTHSLVKVSDDSTSIKDALEYNKQECTKYARDFYIVLVNALLTGLNDLNSKYPVMVLEVLNEFDRAVVVPPNMQQLNESLPKPLDGKRFTDSVANLCALLGVVSIANFKTTGKEAWIKCIS